MEYLIDLTSGFTHSYHIISQTKRPTINIILPVYNTLLDHIESVRKKLSSKRGQPNEKWKTDLLEGVAAAEMKLRDYYGQTVGKNFWIYGYGVLLDPHRKLSYWRTSDFKNDPVWEDRYWDGLKKYFVKFYSHREVPERVVMVSPQGMESDPMDNLIDRKRRSTYVPPPMDDEEDEEFWLPENEFARYRDSSKYLMVHLMVHC